LPSKKISLDLQIINPEWRTIDTAVFPRARHASDRKSKQGSRVEKNAKNYTKTRRLLIPSPEIKDLKKKKGKK